MARRSVSEYLDNYYRNGGDTAFVQRRGYRVQRWTYRQTADLASQFARELESRGIAKGERVLLWGENCAEWIAVFFGCLLRGAVVVPMDRIGSADFAGRVARQVEARLAVGSREQIDCGNFAAVLAFETLVQALEHHSNERYQWKSGDPEEPVEIVFTSGTTADPKGVVISHRNILANLEPLESEIGKYLRYERIVHPIRFLNLLPLSHVFGQFLGIFVPQLLAGTVVFQDSLNPAEIVATVRRERVSVLVAVPRLLEALREKIESDFEASARLDWFRRQFEAARGEHFVRRWWRFREIHRKLGWKFWALISGGAALNSETESFWGRLGFAVIQGYGLTETTSLISVNHPFKLGKGSIGKVLPGREVKLDSSGEILVRGKSVASGYWQGNTLAPVAGQEDWFHTGDVGELDSEGNLYFKGRKKNVIVTREGMNIYPGDLEAALREQTEIRDAVVVALERSGNAEPCAVLLVHDGDDQAAAAVKRANQALAEYQHIRHWLLWPEKDFPRTATQKPRTNQIQEFARTRLTEGSGAPAAAGSLAEMIRQVTGRAPGSLSPDAKLSLDLNLSSLDRVQLMSAIEDRYQVELNETSFAAATTVGELEQMIRRPSGGRTNYEYPRWTQRELVRWLRIAVYYLLVWPATLLLAFPRIVGRQNLKGVSGPALVISNHIASVDVGFILAALPARFRHRLAVAMEGEQLKAMRRPAAAGLFKGWVEKLSYALVVALFNVFPLPQQSGFRSSFAFAGESVDRGYSLLVFPEGQRTEHGQMNPFRAGIGLLVRNLNIPVIPLKIEGLFPLKQAGKKMVSPGTIRVYVGKPVSFAAETDAEEITRRLEQLVGSLGTAPARPLRDQSSELE